MNQKGQSFDVFQLLIAAVVAIAIMGILFGVLGQVGIGTGTDIGSDIRTQIKKASNEGYASPQNNFKVTIAPGTTITPANVVKDTDITSDQLCISTGDFGDDALFEAQDTGAVKYTGSSSRKIGISVLCGRGADLTDNLAYISSEADSYDTSSCSGWDACNEPTSGTCCLVALRRV